MKFGIFYEISVPRPWDHDIEKTVYDNCLEQVSLADELGFDQVWAVEHHFLEEYSHCPAPELFLTACAMQTKNIRVGHGIVVCVPEFNHPIRVAERCAVLDILSGGPARSRHGPLGDVDRAGGLPGAIPTTPRRPGTSSCASCRRCGRRNASPTRARLLDARAGGHTEAVTRSRIRRCGWR